MHSLGEEKHCGQISFEGGFNAQFDADLQLDNTGRNGT